MEKLIDNIGRNYSVKSKGTVIVIVGVLLLTPDSLLVRLLSDLNDFTVIFYRYLIMSSALVMYMLACHGPLQTYHKFLMIGYRGLFAGVIWGVQNFLITYAFQKTAIATVLVINASSPMFAAVFTWILLRESIPWYTLLAAIVCFGAIVSIFYSQLGAGAGQSEMAGLFCSLGSALLFGLYVTVIRLAG